jgi:hypothetical protein
VADTDTAISTGGAISIDVLDKDPTGSTLSGIVDPVSGNVVSSTTLASGADVSVSGGQISYDPNGFVGTDTFEYETNGGRATVSVTVSAPPVGAPVDDTDSTADNSTPVTVDVLANDPAGSILQGIVDPVTSATVATATLASGATVTVSGTQITYDPNGTTATSDTFDYRTQSGQATVNITIGASGTALGQVVLQNNTNFQSTWTITQGTFIDPVSGGSLGTSVTVAPLQSDTFHIALGPTGTPSLEVPFSVDDPQPAGPATNTFTITEGVASGDTQTEIDYDGSTLTSTITISTIP